MEEPGRTNFSSASVAKWWLQEWRFRKPAWQAAIVMHDLCIMLLVRTILETRIIEMLSSSGFQLPHIMLAVPLLPHALMCIYLMEGIACLGHFLGGVLCACMAYAHHSRQHNQVTLELQQVFRLSSRRRLASANESVELKDVLIPLGATLGFLACMVGAYVFLGRCCSVVQTAPETDTTAMHNVLIGSPGAVLDNTQASRGSCDDTQMSKIAVCVKCGITEIALQELDYRTVKQFTGMQLKHAVFTRMERRSSDWKLIFDDLEEQSIPNDWLLEPVLQERSWPIDVHVMPA